MNKMSFEMRSLQGRDRIQEITNDGVISTCAQLRLVPTISGRVDDHDG